MGAGTSRMHREHGNSHKVGSSLQVEERVRQDWRGDGHEMLRWQPILSFLIDALYRRRDCTERVEALIVSEPDSVW